jgi:hypothetical protein
MSLALIANLCSNFERNLFESEARWRIPVRPGDRVCHMSRLSTVRRQGWRLTLNKRVGLWRASSGAPPRKTRICVWCNITSYGMSIGKPRGKLLFDGTAAMRPAARYSEAHRSTSYVVDRECNPGKQRQHAVTTYLRPEQHLAVAHPSRPSLLALAALRVLSEGED